jgi:hypothetical protein
VVLHVENARGVVTAFKQATEADEMQRIVLEHGPEGHPAGDRRTQLDPVEEFADPAREDVLEILLAQFDPGGVDAFPHLGGQRAAHGVRIFARGTQATVDRRGIGRVGNHEAQDVLDIHLVVDQRKSGLEAVEGENGAPVLVLRGNGLRHQ